MKLERATVLIVSSDPAFARAITDTWPGPQAPEFVVLKEDLCRDLQPDTYDLAIAELSSESKREMLSSVLALSGAPTILIDSTSSASPGVRGSVVTLPRENLPSNIVGIVAREMLRRAHADQRAAEAERTCALAQAEATLGRYISEMRHNVNNALTSVLGNAELMQLEPGLPASVIEQADTIRNMALRLHEIFQRFSSIEKELHVLARESFKTASSAPALSSRASAGSI